MLKRLIGQKFIKENIAECFGMSRHSVYFKKTDMIEKNDFLIVIVGVANTDIKYYFYVDENKIIRKITPVIDYSKITDVTWKGSDRRCTKRNI